MTKNRNIPQWQKSVFDNSVDKTSCVKTKPISTSRVKKLEKDFFDQNYHTIKLKDPELFEEYKKEFSIKNKSKITEAKDLTDKNQSSYFNQNKSNSDDELKDYIEQKKLERKFEIEQLRKEEKDPVINFKFNQVKKDLNCGMGFVNPHRMINQNSLGHSQSWRFKKQKKYNYYD